MLLPSSLLILLSVAASEEVRTCFWCGPMADQVHRSQRAPACGEQLAQTTCDAGYTHCATVASSPPYAESRMCVKFYQDQCYSLYCNSSKTWRMICPCQGHLCNGQNTDRETRAFATLAKIEGKHKRSKRSQTIKGFFPQKKTATVGLEEQTTVSTITDFDVAETTSVLSNDVMEGNDIGVEDNIVEQGDENKMQADQPAEEQIESIDAPSTADNVEQGDENKMQGDQPVEEQIEGIEAASTANEMGVDTEVKQSETITIINMDTTISEENSFEREKILITTSQAESVKETESVTVEVPSLPTTLELEVSVAHVKQPDNMPPPEALQQTVAPIKVETTTTPTTLGTIETSTINNHKEVTHSLIETLHINEIAKNKGGNQNQTKKNGAGETNVSLWGILIMHVLVYITW